MRFNKFVVLVAPLLVVGTIDAIRRILPELLARFADARFRG
jgi:hypothetical protein